MAGVTPRESALPRVKTRRHVTPHVMSCQQRERNTPAGMGLRCRIWCQHESGLRKATRSGEREQREIKEWPLHTDR